MNGHLNSLGRSPVHAYLSATNRLVDRVLNRLALWMARMEQRRQLLELDDRQLKDMGIRRGQAVAESHKGFWEK